MRTPAYNATTVQHYCTVILTHAFTCAMLPLFSQSVQPAHVTSLIAAQVQLAIMQDSDMPERQGCPKVTICSQKVRKQSHSSVKQTIKHLRVKRNALRDHDDIVCTIMFSNALDLRNESLLFTYSGALSPQPLLKRGCRRLRAQMLKNCARRQYSTESATCACDPVYIFQAKVIESV